MDKKVNIFLRNIDQNTLNKIDQKLELINKKRDGKD